MPVPELIKPNIFYCVYDSTSNFHYDQVIKLKNKYPTLLICPLTPLVCDAYLKKIYPEIHDRFSNHAQLYLIGYYLMVMSEGGIILDLTMNINRNGTQQIIIEDNKIIFYQSVQKPFFDYYLSTLQTAPELVKNLNFDFQAYTGALFKLLIQANKLMVSRNLLVGVQFSSLNDASNEKSNDDSLNETQDEAPSDESSDETSDEAPGDESSDETSDEVPNDTLCKISHYEHPLMDSSNNKTNYNYIYDYQTKNIIYLRNWMTDQMIPFIIKERELVQRMKNIYMFVHGTDNIYCIISTSPLLILKLDPESRTYQIVSAADITDGDNHVLNARGLTLNLVGGCYFFAHYSLLMVQDDYANYYYLVFDHVQLKVISMSDSFLFEFEKGSNTNNYRITHITIKGSPLGEAQLYFEYEETKNDGKNDAMTNNIKVLNLAEKVQEKTLMKMIQVKDIFPLLNIYPINDPRIIGSYRNAVDGTRELYLHTHTCTDVISKAIAEKGIWEPEITHLLDWLQSQASNAYPCLAPLFMDIGANLGYYSFIAASKGVKTISFEPVVDTYTKFQLSQALNKLNDLTCLYTCALSNKEYIGSFSINPSNMGGASGRENFVQTSFLSLLETIERNNIVFKPLDSVNFEDINLKDHAIIIKMDAEGLEPEILQGGLRFFSENLIYAIIVEITILFRSASNYLIFSEYFPGNKYDYYDVGDNMLEEQHEEIDALLENKIIFDLDFINSLNQKESKQTNILIIQKKFSDLN
jgi:FkbM family methyltransferase